MTRLFRWAAESQVDSGRAGSVRGLSCWDKENSSSVCTCLDGPRRLGSTETARRIQELVLDGLKKPYAKIERWSDSYE